MARTAVTYNAGVWDVAGVTPTGNPVTVTDANLSTSDITTNDVSTSKHGFAPKAPGDATKYLDGSGAYTVPPSGTQWSVLTNGDATTPELVFAGGDVVMVAT